MVFIVFILHFTQYLGGTTSSWYSTNIARLFTAGALSVYTFLSGLLSAKHRFANANDFIHYYKGRFVRIYPLYLFAVVGFYLFGLLDNSQALLSAMGYFGCLIPNAPKTLWYICMLMMFYLIMPFLNYASEKYKSIYSVIGFILFEILFVADVVFIGGDRRLLLYWPFYFAGNSIARFGLKEKLFRTANIVFSVIISVLCIFVIFIGAIKNNVLIEFFFGCSLIITLYLIGKAVTKVKSIACIIKDVAYSSYVVYLFHRIVYELTFVKLGGVQVWLVPLLFLFIIITSYMIQYCYDFLIDRRLSNYNEPNKY